MAAKLTHVDTTEDLKLAETILEKYGIRSAHRVRFIPSFRFRHTPEALEFQPSLAYALVRNYLDLGQKERLLPILNDTVTHHG